MGSDVEDENIDDIFVFSDEKYSKEVMLRLDRLRNDGNMCDVVLKVNGHDFPVHRNILSASSDYFFAMFNGNMRESSQQEVRISGVDCESMKAIVNFIYTGEISLTWSNVQPILQAANLMLVQSVKNACVRFLESRMSVRNCIGIQVIAETYACEELLEFAIQYMNRNFLNVAAGDEFLNLSAKEMSVVLSSDEICVENEEKVYEALIFWIGHDQERRRQDFPRLLELIRLPLISPYYLVDVVEREEMMNLSPRCKVLLLEAQHYHMLPERREELDNERTKPRNYDRFQEMLIAIGGNGEVHSTSTGTYVRAKKSYSRAKTRPPTGKTLPLCGVPAGMIHGRLPQHRRSDSSLPILCLSLVAINTCYPHGDVEKTARLKGGSFPNISMRIVIGNDF